MKRYSFHVAMLLSQPFCTRRLVASRGAFSHQEREWVYLVDWLDTKALPGGPRINLPLAKTEPTRREQVQNTIVIGFLAMLPDVLVRSPQTQWLARGMARSHEHWLRCSVRTRGRGLDSLLSNVNWNFRHSGHGCRLQSCDRLLPQ